jgi:hypothetical protein
MTDFIPLKSYGIKSAKRGHRDNEQGFAVLLFALMLAAASFSYIYLTDFSIMDVKQQKFAALSADKQALQEYFERNVSCYFSFDEDTTCPSKDFIPLYKNVNGVKTLLVSKDGSQFGDWTAVAECNPSNTGLRIRLAKLLAGGTVRSKDKGKFKKDPLTGQTATWDSDASLLQPDPQTICPKTSNKGYPKPDFDSGWTAVTSSRTFYHNLGTNSFDYVIYCRNGSGNPFLCWSNTHMTMTGSGRISSSGFSYITMLQRDNNQFTVGRGGWFQSIAGGSFTYIPQHDWAQYFRADQARVMLWKTN